MDSFLEEQFIRELKIQCSFAAFAFEDIQAALASHDQIDRLWFSVQNFLNSAANLSKMLWPIMAKYAYRGEFFRNKLRIEQDSPLKSREVRNCFEHFDEHVHEWIASLDSHNLIDRNVGPAKIWCPTGHFENDKKYFLRNFDQSNFELLFRGKIYELGPLMQEIQCIEDRVNKLNS